MPASTGLERTGAPRWFSAPFARGLLVEDAGPAAEAPWSTRQARLLGALLIWSFERVALPWVGATPPLRTWPTVDILPGGHPHD